MRHFKITIIITLIIFMSSCNDFLDLKPHDSVAYDEAIENEADAQVALNGVYSGMRSASLYSRLLVLLPDVMTDAALAAVGYTNQLGIMYTYSYVPGSQDVRAVWRQAYVTVARANNVINKIDEGLEGEQEALDNIKGQALFIRAMIHFDLVRIFGPAYTVEPTGRGIPYVKTVDVNNAPARESVDAVYTMVIEDLIEARTLIISEGRKNSGRITKAACDALLARVYLNMGNNVLAAEYATDVIDSGIYSFFGASATTHQERFNEFMDIWRFDEGEEVIFRLIYTPTEVAGRLGANYYNDAQGPPNPDYLPAQWLLDLYETEDMRYNVYFQHNVNVSGGWSASLINKYPGNPDFTENGANMPKPLRLAEMYLIAAEAYAADGDATNARRYLNELREQRIENYVFDETISGNALEEAIWNERLKELAFEGHYWFDLKRKQKGFERIPQANTFTANDLAIEPADYRWLWPIPQDEMNGNENMVQNQGY